MHEKEYTLTFTVGPGLVAESIKTAELFVVHRKWNLVRDKVIQDNTFQSRTRSTLVKRYREVHRRLALLTNDEISLLAFGSETEKRHLLWMAICLKYRLIREFAAEVLVNRYDYAQYSASYTEYDLYFAAKADFFANLSNATTNTRRKARQVIFRMLHDCGLLDENGEILPQQLSTDFRRVVAAAGHAGLPIFPGVGVWQ